jgi:pimeloyl-ACP methyl ester carboxylesterase
VTRLALINAVGSDEWLGEDVKLVQRGTARLALRIARGMLGAAPLLAPVLERSVADPRFMPTALLARYVAPFVGTEGILHLLALVRALDPDDLAGLDLTAVRASTLIVRGEEDQWVRDEVSARLHEAIPGSEILRMPNVARLVPEEAPEALSAALVRLMSATVRSTPTPVAAVPAVKPSA